MSAATPWSQVEAEAVKGGSSTTSTPAQKDNGGEGEAIVRSVFLSSISLYATTKLQKSHCPTLDASACFNHSVWLSRSFTGIITSIQVHDLCLDFVNSHYVKHQRKKLTLLAV